jgi:hypothetical protein
MSKIRSKELPAVRVYVGLGGKAKYGVVCKGGEVTLTNR